MTPYYTKDDKQTLERIHADPRMKRCPLSEATGAAMLDALGEQQNTLQNVESILQRMESVILRGEQSQ